MSEGIDFADGQARAVVCVGIPYPNVKDARVQQKKNYNDRHASSKGLLNGNEWFEVQAFRALNQALGRCIRHRNDWGAVIFMDQRFVSDDRYRNNLSKWIRTRTKKYVSLHEAKSSLKEFVVSADAFVVARAAQEKEAEQASLQEETSKSVVQSDTVSCASSPLPFKASLKKPLVEGTPVKEETRNWNTANARILPDGIPASAMAPFVFEDTPSREPAVCNQPATASPSFRKVLSPIAVPTVHTMTELQSINESKPDLKKFMLKKPQAKQDVHKRVVSTDANLNLNAEIQQAPTLDSPRVGISVVCECGMQLGSSNYSVGGAKHDIAHLQYPQGLFGSAVACSIALLESGNLALLKRFADHSGPVLALDTFYSAQDKIAYQHYTCVGCKRLVGLVALMHKDNALFIDSKLVNQNPRPPESASKNRKAPEIIELDSDLFDDANKSTAVEYEFLY